MEVDLKFIARACPELTQAEACCIRDQLHSDGRYGASTMMSIRELARSMFPGVLEDDKVVHIDHRNKIKEAIMYLETALETLDEIPERVLTDTTAMTMNDLNGSVFYLTEEIKTLEKKRNFT